jgi:hypothetical protein
LNPVDTGSSVPLSATAQLLLPGTDAAAVPVQLIVPFDASVACADPVPLIGTLPLHVAEKLPDTDVAVMLEIVQENPPQVPCCDPADCVDEKVPALRLVLRSDVVTADCDGDVAFW